MTADLAARVTWTGAATVAALTVGAWWLAGVPAAAGVSGGGGIALVNFRWLARDVGRATALIAATTIRITPSAAASLALPAM